MSKEAKFRDIVPSSLKQLITISYTEVYEIICNWELIIHNSNTERSSFIL